MNTELTPMIEDWVRAACRYYITKNPTTPAMLWGSVAKYFTGLSEDIPRDVDILPCEAVNRFAFKHIDHSGNMEAYPILLEGSTEFEGNVRMPSRIGLMVAKLCFDSLERMPAAQALVPQLTQEELLAVKAVLEQHPTSVKAQAGLVVVAGFIAP